jgi:hypothetical protein
MRKGVYIHYAILGKLKTYYATYILLFATYPFIITLFLLLEAKRVLLHDLGIDQGSDDTGIAEEKYIYRVELVDAFINITDPLAALYKYRKDMENYRKMKFVRGKCIKARPEKLLQDVDGAIAFCGLNTPDCTEAGIIPGKITNLSAARNKFAPYADLPNTTKKLKKGVTAKINAIDIEVTDILNNQLDGAMKAIKDTQPQAYSEFTLIVQPIREGVHSHNIIVDKYPVTFTAVHDLTGDPVANVPIKITGISGSFTTGVDGKAFANLPLGVYVGKITYIDFIAQTFTFTVTEAGVELTIRLVPVGV